MIQVKCTRCGGIAEGKTFDEASSRVNHGIGLTKGKPCHKALGKTIQTSGQEEKPKKQKKTKSDNSKTTEENTFNLTE